MKKIISIRISDQDERRIKELKEWFKKGWPFDTKYTTTDIIRASISTLYNVTIKSNK